MTKKPWGGRFKKKMDKDMLLFSESVSFDCRLFDADIAGSIAHARVLGQCGVITRAEAGKLIRALEAIRKEAFAGKLPLSIEFEDIHMNVEARLRDKMGALAGKLHTGRSRNDQVALDMRLYFREEARAAIEAVTELCRALVNKASEYHDAVMPGFTHTRKAQPVLFAHHLLAYVEMLLRDRDRLGDCLRRINVCPLGAGALAGTAFAIDRGMAARELGFEGLAQNSMDAVSDRDYLLEIAACAAIIMIHLSRMMEEFIWWGLPELGFVELDESLCTGSSMMPNKKNPDAAELVRGKSGRVIGSLVSLLTVMKGTPLSYNRDFQEDKEGMFDLTDTLLACLQISGRLVETMKPNPDMMRKAAGSGFMLATDLADYLAARGMPFREAHETAGRMVRYCEEHDKALEDLDLATMQKFSPLIKKDVKNRLSLEASLKRRDVVGGTGPEQVSKQIRRLKKILAMNRKKPAGKSR